jgi:alpha,alpha-trehalose phosphorylase (configuration-retaining)
LTYNLSTNNTVFQGMASISSLKDEIMKNEKVLQVGQPAEQSALPAATYAHLHVQDQNLHVAEEHNSHLVTYIKTLLDTNSDESALSWLKRAADENDLQIIAASLNEGDFSLQLGSRLWLEEDIVPLIAPKDVNNHASTEDLILDVRTHFDQDNLAKVSLSPEREVLVSELGTLDDYRRIVSQEDFEQLELLAQKFVGKRLIFINATPQGGGVALMRHALIRLLRLLGVDAHWHILLPQKEIFAITKTKFHNVLQNVASPATELTEEDKQLYLDWSAENARELQPVLQRADVIVIDDPQPAGLIPHIKQINPAANILYRSHIQIVAELANIEGTPQHTTWSFLWNFIRQADLFISHPLQMFVPDSVPAEKVLYMPATTDPVDGLNKPLSEHQMAIYMEFFNQILLEDGQLPLDSERPYLVQIARFDPSKGIPDVLDAYRQLRHMLEEQQQPIPQLIIAGNGSIDDPDGKPIYNLIKRILQTEPYRSFANDIKVARLPHRDQVLNTLLRKSKVVLQLSIKEGFEVKVTEALLKGKPVVAYRAGGIPLQIQDTVTGYLVETGNTAQVAMHLYELLTNEQLYQSMSNSAEVLANKDYLTTANAICWLYLATELREGEQLEGNYRWVRSLSQQIKVEEAA